MPRTKQTGGLKMSPALVRSRRSDMVRPTVQGGETESERLLRRRDELMRTRPKLRTPAEQDLLNRRDQLMKTRGLLRRRDNLMKTRGAVQKARDTLPGFMKR